MAAVYKNPQVPNLNTNTCPVPDFHAAPALARPVIPAAQPQVGPQPVPQAALRNNQQGHDGQKTAGVERQCQICLENSKDFVTLACGHQDACKTCLGTIVNNAINAKNATDLRCPTPKCTHGNLELADLQKITNDRRKVELINGILTNQYLNAQGNVKYCPGVNCGYAFINDDNRVQNIECPKCKRIFCSGCLERHPGNVTCKDAEIARRAQNAPGAANNERATEEWKRRNTKPCPKCNAAIEKNDGCLKMRCQKCRAEFCWDCMRLWDGAHPSHYRCPNARNNVARHNH